MNERLVLSTMALGATEPPQPDQRPSLDWGKLWMQYILDTCATIEDVIAANDLVRIAHTVDHYLVTDRSGNAMVVELLEGEMVTHSGGELPVAALTNTSYQDSINTWFANRDRRTPGCPTPSGGSAWSPTGSPPPAHQQRGRGNGRIRHPRARSPETSPSGASSSTLGVCALFLHAEPPGNPVCRPDAAGAAMRETLADARHPRGALGDLFAHLFDLSYDVCYEHTEQYLITTGELDDETAAGLPLSIEQITSFPCERIRRRRSPLRFVAQ